MISGTPLISMQMSFHEGWVGVMIVPVERESSPRLSMLVAKNTNLDEAPLPSWANHSKNKVLRTDRNHLIPNQVTSELRVPGSHKFEYLLSL